MKFRTLEERVADMESDLADLVEAKWLALHGGRIEICGCGALTVAKPCPKCRRDRKDHERANENSVV